MTELCETNRLLLRLLPPEYYENVLEFYIANRNHFDPYELTRPSNFYTEDYMRSLCTWEWNEIQAEHTLRYYIFLKTDPSTIIGTVNFSSIQYGAFSKAVIGYKIDHRYTGHGYAYEASKKALDIIFNEYCLHRVDTLILPDNAASIRIIEKLGFQYEGTERETAYVNSRWRDMMRYGLLRSEFNEQKAP